MITAKEAVNIATNYYRDLMSYYENPVVEEIELVDETISVWKVTLGIPDRMSVALGVGRNKDYKIFTIRASDGEVLSMKIRTI